MNDPADPVTLALTGTLPALLIVAALLALPVSLALLWRYRRAVQRAMDATAGAAGAATVHVRVPGAAAVSGDGAAREPTVALPTISVPPAMLLRRALRAPWRLAAIYAAGGAGYAVIIAGGWWGANPADAAPLRLVVLAWIYAWPVVLATCFVAAIRWRERLAVGLAYTIVLLLLGVIGLADRRLWWSLLVLWGLYNAAPTVLLLAFLHRRIRAVGPLVFAFLVLAALGSGLTLSVLAASDGAQRFAFEVGWALELDAWELMFAAGVLGCLLFGVLGAVAVRWVRGRYERKVVSDQSILLDAVWLLFAASHAAFFAFDGVIWVLSGPAAFLVYKAFTRVGHALAGADTGAVAGAPQLLLLRVFALGRRSEALFDNLTLHWRHIGSVRLIAGPDLVTTTLEPHEFLDYLTGKLARRFVDGAMALESRLAEMDVLPDRDGRYRVNEFFCRADMWKEVLARLVVGSHVVLMDLRGFTERNAGCRHEIEELIDRVPLSRVVLITDDTTDTPLLDRVLRDGWQGISPDSPNRGADPGDLCRLRLDGKDAGEWRALLATLCDAAGGETAVAAAA